MTAGEAARPSVSPGTQIEISALEDKIEYYSLFLLAIALAHLTRWGTVAFMATGSAIDELQGKSPIPTALWFAFAMAVIFVLLFVWSFWQRALAMFVGLIIHIPTMLFTGLVANATEKAMGYLPLRFLWQLAWLLSIISAIGLIQGIRASYRYTLLLRSSQKPDKEP